MVCSLSTGFWPGWLSEFRVYSTAVCQLYWYECLSCRLRHMSGVNFSFSRKSKFSHLSQWCSSVPLKLGYLGLVISLSKLKRMFVCLFFLTLIFWLLLILVSCFRETDSIMIFTVKSVCDLCWQLILSFQVMQKLK